MLGNVIEQGLVTSGIYCHRLADRTYVGIHGARLRIDMIRAEALLRHEAVRHRIAECIHMT